TNDGSHDADRIDTGMEKKAPVFDSHDGALQIGRDLSERDIVTLLVETKPRLAVRREKCGVAHAASQAADRGGIPRHFPADATPDDAEQDDECQNQPAPETRRPEAHFPSFSRYRAATSSSILESFRFSSRRAYKNATPKMTTISPSESHFGT